MLSSIQNFRLNNYSRKRLYFISRSSLFPRIVNLVSLHLISMQPLPSEGLVHATETRSFGTSDISTTALAHWSANLLIDSSMMSKTPISTISLSLSVSADIRNLVNFRGVSPGLFDIIVTESKCYIYYFLKTITKYERSFYFSFSLFRFIYFYFYFYFFFLFLTKSNETPTHCIRKQRWLMTLDHVPSRSFP